MTQLARGELRADATVISGTDGFVYHASVRSPASSAFADLESDYTGIVIPLSWEGRFVVNGADVSHSAIYAPVDGSIFQVHGGNRETVSVALPREQMTATVAALHGIDADEFRLGGGPLDVPPAALARLRCSLGLQLERYIEATRRGVLPSGAHETLTRRIVEAITDLYVQAHPMPKREIRTAGKLGMIVRKAEECFESAQSGPISLADLCAAAGVSQGTLHNAFMVMCGDSPMAHFKKRRLTNARSVLLGSDPSRQLVKIAALDAGLTHFGRFSTEYRRLFGESPSVTLEKRSI